MKLAEEIGLKATSERLGINLDTLYTWKSKEKQHVNVKTSPKISDEEKETEISRLNKELRKS